MGIYFRDILLIRTSRGANNCVQCVFENKIYFITIFPPPPILNSSYPMKGSIFVKKKKKKKIKRINNADTFSQPSLIIFIKGADTFGHDCI